MKTIGLIGGMSWQSTKEYYTYINMEVNRRLGCNYSAKIIMHSFNFQEIKTLQVANKWDKLAILLSDAAIALEKAGADIILICANTMHKVYDQVQRSVKANVLHIGDCTSRSILKDNCDTVGLLGTKYTMSQPFLKEVFEVDYDIKVITPSERSQSKVHDIIIDELCNGVIRPESFHFFFDTVLHLFAQGAKGIVLGCTEIPLIINFNNFNDELLTHHLSQYQGLQELTFYDTTQLHALEAVELALF
jgi:aspartate racemase